MAIDQARPSIRVRRGRATGGEAPHDAGIIASRCMLSKTAVKHKHHLVDGSDVGRCRGKF